MSWSDRLPRRAALIGLLALSGCGFEPLYGSGGAAAGLRGAVEVQEPTTRAGFVMTRALEARLGRPEEVRYRLALDLNITERPAAFTPDRQITRFTLDGRASWQLFDVGGTLIGSGTVESFTAYSATGSTAATLAGEEDALDRLAEILADRVVTELWAAAR